jgi:3',5'-cyclic AMP phosphodiesterase CpdA
MVIGDLHGKDCWKVINIKAYDKIIFLGDYVDHWNLPDLKISQNLEEIIKLKRKHPKKVELLLGNHDVQYLYYPHFLCSGFRPGMQRLLTHLFNSNSDLFKVAYQRGNHLFTHAGITNTWYGEFLNLPLLQQIKDEQDTVADLINKIEKTAQRPLLHRAGSIRGGYGYGGVTWADRKEMIADMLDGYHQVVGHTVVPQVEVFQFGTKSATFIDVLDTLTYFHEIDC